MLRTKIISLLLAGCTAAVLPTAATEEAPSFAEDFEGRLDGGWTWLRPDPQDWCLRQGGLEIRNRPGDAGSVRNALLRPAPDRTNGTWIIEVTVRHLQPPTGQYEQAGITWYSGGEPVFKFVKELVDGVLMMIPGRQPMPAASVRLRLTVTGNRYVAEYQPDAAGPFHRAATGELPAASSDQISLQCYHGPAGDEHWVRFDDFRIAVSAE
ncbi:MAG: hypothetical protein H7A45_06520 [Verrucomicrobiales bacterium]|nr:hypothetical protein [Verrucomicrobiales bacterium]MCP5527601.1 hypothetical protein [Verrucomicrobiales bacterium]